MSIMLEQTNVRLVIISDRDIDTRKLLIREKIKNYVYDLTGITLGKWSSGSDFVNFHSKLNPINKIHTYGMNTDGNCIHIGYTALFRDPGNKYAVCKNSVWECVKSKLSPDTELYIIDLDDKSLISGKPKESLNHDDNFLF